MTKENNPTPPGGMTIHEIAEEPKDAARWRAMCAGAAAEDDEMVTFLDDHMPDGPITKEHLDLAMDAWMRHKGLV